MLKVSACEFGNSISDIYLYSLQHSIISSKTYNELLLSWRFIIIIINIFNYIYTLKFINFAIFLC
jgi:hypothetical protein